MFTEQELLDLIAIEDRFIRDCGQYLYADGIQMGHKGKAKWERMLQEVRSAKSACHACTGDGWREACGGLTAECPECKGTGKAGATN